MMLPGGQVQPVSAASLPPQAPVAETEPDMKKSTGEPSQPAPVAQAPAAHVPDKDRSKAPSPELSHPPPAAPAREEGKTGATVTGEPQKSVHQSVDFDDDQPQLQQEGSASFNRLERVPSKKDDDQVLQESAAAEENDMEEQEKKLAEKEAALAHN